MIAKVQLWGRTIGAVTLDDGREVAAFQYDPEFARSGIEISPLTMPLSKRVYEFPTLSRLTFRGLPGLCGFRTATGCHFPPHDNIGSLLIPGRRRLDSNPCATHGWLAWHSIAGLLDTRQGFLATRPFRSPHQPSPKPACSVARPCSKWR